MTFTLPGTKAPVRMWLDPADVEAEALTQLRNVASLPWTDRVAVMPDCHVGAGATVGSVIGMRDALCPAAVGVDIGCGMNAVRTSLRADDLGDDLRTLRLAIEAAIPVGFNAHARPVERGVLNRAAPTWGPFWSGLRELAPGVKTSEGKAERQLGTLGGGNHFIEVCLDTTGQVWLMLHSGSRNIGKEIAARHIAIAQTQAHNAGLPDRDLAVFLAGTPEMEAYERDLMWAQDYARRNRAVMLELLMATVRAHFASADVHFDEPISCHHNYVDRITVDGVELVVTRKGAIDATAGRRGIIPGSMGAASFITTGLGNAESMFSASHGAGRRMSRAKAKRTFTLDDLLTQTAGVEHRADAGLIDEIPGAYKDIHAVMAAQTDLVRVDAQLKQVLCVKG